jgi:hypothetical protein
LEKKKPKTQEELVIPTQELGEKKIATLEKLKLITEQFNARQKAKELASQIA